MVLSYLGFNFSEQELARLLNTRAIGTFAEDIIRLSQPGFIVNLGSSSLAELKAAINADRPVIVFLHTDALSYWKVDSALIIFWQLLI